MRRAIAVLGVGVVVLAGCTEVEGSGEVVTETRTVSGFDAVDADNGVRVVLRVGNTAVDPVELLVTTDSNLQEFLTTDVSSGELRATADRPGGASPTGPFDVEGDCGPLTSLEANNGARIEVTGEGDDLTVSANNGAGIVASGFQVASVVVEADNGARVVVCTQGPATGHVRNGASLVVECGGSITGIETSGGGRVSAGSG